MEITIRAGRMPGPFTRKIRLASDDPDNPSTMLECKGTIRSVIKANPARLTFGRVKRDAGPQTQKIVIERGDTETLALKLLSNPIKNMELDLKEIEPGERYELTATLSPPWPNDPIRGMLTFLTGAKECPQARLDVNMLIEPRVLIQPKHLIVNSPREKDEEYRTTLRWVGGSQHEVIEASVNDEKLDVSVSKQGAFTSVVLTVPVDYPAVSRRRTITLKTDDDEMPTLELPVSIRPAQRGARAKAGSAIRKQQGVAGTRDAVIPRRRSLKARKLQQRAMQPAASSRD